MSTCPDSIVTTLLGKPADAMLPSGPKSGGIAACSAVSVEECEMFAGGDIFGIKGGISGASESCANLSSPIRPGSDATPPKVNSASPPEILRVSPQPPISQSPGEALLNEFETLFHTNRRRVYRQCYRMVGNSEDAEDLTQEVFLQVFRKAHTFRGEASFSTWLHRLTINTVLMRIRRQRRWRATITSFDAAPTPDRGVTEVSKLARGLPAETGSGAEKIDLDMAITQLPTGYKEILLLHDLEGYRHDEIAQRLGISEGTSKSQLHKARIRIRTLMSKGVGARCNNRRAAPSASYSDGKSSATRRAAYACA